MTKSMDFLVDPAARQRNPDGDDERTLSSRCDREEVEDLFIRIRDVCYN